MNLSSANSFSLEESKNLLFGKGLVVYLTILSFNNWRGEAFANIARKGENAGN